MRTATRSSPSTITACALTARHLAEVRCTRQTCRRLGRCIWSPRSVCSCSAGRGVADARELALPGLQFRSNEQYTQLFTMHGTITLLIYAVPVAYGFANYILPLRFTTSWLDSTRPRTRYEFGHARAGTEAFPRVYFLENIRENNPGVFGSAVWPLHRLDVGTPLIT